MRQSVLHLAVALLLGAATSCANALGIGHVTESATLGHPLDFVVDVRLDTGEVLAAKCAQASVMLGDHRLQKEAVSTQVENADGGQHRVRVTTLRRVDEPVVQVELQLGCPTRMTRTFVLFADPPRDAVSTRSFVAPALASNGSTTRGASPESLMVPAQDAPRNQTVAAASTDLALAPSSATTSAPASSQKSSEASRDNRRPAVAATMPPVKSSEAVPSRAASSTRAAKPAAPPVRQARAEAPPRPTPVLRLDDLSPVALKAAPPAVAAPQTSPAEGLAIAAALTALDDARQAQARANERLEALERSLAQMTARAQAQEAALRDVQAQLREAGSRQYANPLVYALGLLSLLLAAGLFRVLRIRGRDRIHQAWWLESRDGLGEGPGAAEPDGSVNGPLVVERWAPLPTPDVADLEDAPNAERAIQRLHASGASASTAALWARPEVAGAEAGMSLRRPSSDLDGATGSAPQEPRTVSEAAMVAAVRRPMSADELIDLEQQADFFMVLGQDEAAIDLLMGHLRGTGGVSPLPYLKLLEIYRRRGELDAYERIRERFNRRFNANAPDASHSLEEGATLDGYPAVLDQIQAVWGTPLAAMQFLERALFGRDAESAFAVPAYRELLFLHRVAQDLAQRQSEQDGVDLLLPLGDDEGARAGGDSELSVSLDLSGMGSLGVTEVNVMDLDLDVTQAHAPDLLQLPRVQDTDFGSPSNLVEFDDSGHDTIHPKGSSAG